MLRLEDPARVPAVPTHLTPLFYEDPHLVQSVCPPLLPQPHTHTCTSGGTYADPPRALAAHVSLTLLVSSPTEQQAAGA